MFFFNIFSIFIVLGIALLCAENSSNQIKNKSQKKRIIKFLETYTDVPEITMQERLDCLLQITQDLLAVYNKKLSHIKENHLLVKSILIAKQNCELIEKFAVKDIKSYKRQAEYIFEDFVQSINSEPDKANGAVVKRLLEIGMEYKDLIFEFVSFVAECQINELALEREDGYLTIRSIVSSILSKRNTVLISFYGSGSVFAEKLLELMIRNESLMCEMVISIDKNLDPTNSTFIFKNFIYAKWYLEALLSESNHIIKLIIDLEKKTERLSEKHKSFLRWLGRKCKDKKYLIDSMMMDNCSRDMSEIIRKKEKITESILNEFHTKNLFLCEDHLQEDHLQMAMNEKNESDLIEKDEMSEFSIQSFFSEIYDEISLLDARIRFIDDIASCYKKKK